MSEFIYTQKRTRQYNGPVDSSDHNARIEENYKDLVYLYNKYNVTDQKLTEAFQRVLKDHIFTTADSWMKLYFMRDYNFPFYRANIDRYQNGIDKKEFNVIKVVSTSLLVKGLN